jgi:hypothetical protein
VQEFYRFLQESIGDRVLVDKTPAYALDLETLRRSETDFENALHIHLVRHPNAMIRSFREAKLQQAIRGIPHFFSEDAFAEIVWAVSQSNILEFLETIPTGRKHQVRFEDLVRNPVEIVEGLCRFLQIDFRAEMLEPYEKTANRMTDGVNADVRPLGDQKFYRQKAINPAVADQWRQDENVRALSDPTWKIAEALGYDKPSSEDDGAPSEKLLPLEPVSREHDLPLSFAQQRLWFVDQLSPNIAFYNMPLLFRVMGAFDVAGFRWSLNEVVRRHEILRTTFPSVDGRPVQRVSASLDLAIPEIDLRDLPKEEQEGEARRLAEDAAQSLSLWLGARSFALQSCASTAMIA